MTRPASDGRCSACLNGLSQAHCRGIDSRWNDWSDIIGTPRSKEVRRMCNVFATHTRILRHPQGLPEGR